MSSGSGISDSSREVLVPRIYGGRWSATTSSTTGDYVKRSGDSMTGTLDMSMSKIQRLAVCTAADDCVPKHYCDANPSYVKKSGDSMSGTLNMGANQILCTHTATTDDALVNLSVMRTSSVQKEGDSMTGDLLMGAHAVKTAYIAADATDLVNKATLERTARLYAALPTGTEASDSYSFLSDLPSAEAASCTAAVSSVPLFTTTYDYPKDVRAGTMVNPLSLWCANPPSNLASPYIQCAGGTDLELGSARASFAMRATAWSVRFENRALGQVLFQLTGIESPNGITDTVIDTVTFDGPPYGDTVGGVSQFVRPFPEESNWKQWKRFNVFVQHATDLRVFKVVLVPHMVDCAMSRPVSCPCPIGPFDTANLCYLEGNYATIDSVVDGYVSKAGDTMTGDLELGSNAIRTSFVAAEAGDVTNRGFVIASCVQKSGDVMSGSLDMGANKISTTFAASVDSDVANLKAVRDYSVSKGGDTMTGPLVMGANKITSSYIATADSDIVNKKLLDESVAAVGTGGSQPIDALYASAGADGPPGVDGQPFIGPTDYAGSASIPSSVIVTFSPWFSATIKTRGFDGWVGADQEYPQDRLDQIFFQSYPRRGATNVYNNYVRALGSGNPEIEFYFPHEVDCDGYEIYFRPNPLTEGTVIQPSFRYAGSDVFTTEGGTDMLMGTSNEVVIDEGTPIRRARREFPSMWDAPPKTQNSRRRITAIRFRWTTWTTGNIDIFAMGLLNLPLNCRARRLTNIGWPNLEMAPNSGAAGTDAVPVAYLISELQQHLNAYHGALLTEANSVVMTGTDVTLQFIVDQPVQCVVVTSTAPMAKLARTMLIPQIVPPPATVRDVIVVNRTGSRLVVRNQDDKVRHDLADNAAARMIFVGGEWAHVQ